MTKYVFAPLLLVLGVVSACAGRDGAHPGAQPAAEPASVAVVRREPFALTYRASGTVRGRNTAVLTSKTLGYVRAVHVKPGDGVSAGQVLAELEANDVRAGVSGARAALAVALATRAEARAAVEAASVSVELSETTQARVAALRVERAVSQQDLDDADARLRGARAQERIAHARLESATSSIEQARAALTEAQAVLGYSKIVAPFAGQVLERRVDPGALASPEVPLFVVADSGTQRVEVGIDESRLPAVRLGDEAEISIESLPAPLRGAVVEIVPQVDVDSRAFLVKLDLPPGTQGVRPGTFARAAFRIGSESRLAVPATAVTEMGALERVFVVEQGTARLRMITRGETQGPWAFVLSGLSEGETVVRMPSAALRDGGRVEVIP